MLKIENISSGYGKKQVLYNVSFEVKQGEVVLIRGGNGSGKSTLLKCIYNLLPLWSGTITFNGERIDGLKPSDLIKKGIVYIPQKNFYFENLTVEENLQISGNTIPKKILKERIEDVYQQTDLEKFRKRKPFSLSGGERKLLAFGMAMIHKPRLFLFDEPFAGVDLINSDILKKLVCKATFKTYNCIVIVEHKDFGHNLYTRKMFIELGNIKLN